MKPLDAWTMPLEGTSLIEASAGTGKTYTLTTLYLRLLVEEDLSPGEILVVTYTEAATAELRDRVRDKIRAAIAEDEKALADDGAGEAPEPDAEAVQLRALAAQARDAAERSGRPDRLRDALARFDEAAIFTIHGFCQRTLRENAFESGLAFDADLVERSEPIERTLAHDLFRRLIADEDERFLAWLRTGAGKRWNFDPDSLYDDVLRALGADETMPIVPVEAPAPVDALAGGADPVATVAAAMRAWAAGWGEGGARMVEVLVGKNDIGGRKFGKKTIHETWVPAFDAFARAIEVEPDDGRLPELPLPSTFERCTTGFIAQETKPDGTPPEDPLFALFSAVVDSIAPLDASRNARALALRQAFVRLAREEAERRRQERHVLFFDDLLSELRRAVDGAAGASLRRLLRSRYRFALIDEFQDTDPVQYDIFRQVWHERGDDEPGGLMLIGDPKQAIYGFRGADVFTYLAAHEKAGDRVYGLGTNWRSDPGLISAVNAIFENAPQPFRLDAIGFDPVEARSPFEPTFRPAGHPAEPLRFLFADREAVAEIDGQPMKSPTSKVLARFGRTLLMDAIATDIVSLLESDTTIDERRVQPSDVAILCRRKVELAQARRALERAGVPCVDRGDANVFETREAWELACVLHAMRRPNDPGRLRAALSTAAHGLGADEIAALEDDSEALAAWSKCYAEWGRIWSQVGFSPAFEAWRRGAEITPRLLAHRDGERRVTNWLHLAELLQRLASERSPSRVGLVDALERAIASEEARAVFGGDASLLRLERDDEAVQLVTLHRSKGLEYPIVYLPSLWESESGRMPGIASAEKEDGSTRPIRFNDPHTGRRTFDLAGHDAYADHVRQAREEAFSEQLRLIYVGLTRARHQCVVAWGAMVGASSKAFAWLLDPDQADIEREKSAKKRGEWLDADWRAAFERVAARAMPGAVSIEAPRLGERRRWNPEQPEKPVLAFAERTRVLEGRVRTTSFSALTREGVRAELPASGPEVEGRDLDESASADGRGRADFEREADAPSDLAGDMGTFPRGADAGTLLHDVLEHADLRAVAEGTADLDQIRDLAGRKLQENGLPIEHTEQVVHVVAATATAPLRPAVDGFRLGAVAAGQLRPEIEFTLTAPGGAEADFEPGALAKVLETAPVDSPLARYADRAGRLGFQRLSGFLRGFIDAVFFDGERYFLADYKSNHLGDHQADYAPDALIEPMIDHDYVLQYLLYTVALDRHLASRIADYDYDRDFGGIYYLFLRGFAPTHAAGCGVFFDRPPKAIVRAVSALLGEPDALETKGAA